jgi:RecB family exonuclease
MFTSSGLPLSTCFGDPRKLSAKPLVALTPRPEPLRHVGPSQAGELLDCGYRLAWDRDRSTARPAPHPKAVLGVIGHKVCEAAGKGRLGQADEAWRDRFDARWGLEVSAAARAFPNLGEPEGWPGYNLQKVLWRNAAHQVTQRAESWEARGDEDVGPSYEVPLQGFDGRIRGSADAILRRGDQVEIRDFKSGRLFADNSTELKATYRLQLLLYAALYAESFGRWPTKLAIDPLTRPSIEFEVDQIEAKRAVQKTLLAMDQFNEALEAGRLQELARPNDQTCRFCNYVLRCEPFWRRVNATWEGSPRAASGIVVTVQPGILELRIDTGSILPGTWVLRGVPAWGQIPVGSRLWLTGFDIRSEWTLACNETTVLQRVSPADVKE